MAQDEGSSGGLQVDGFYCADVSERLYPIIATLPVEFCCVALEAAYVPCNVLCGGAFTEEGAWTGASEEARRDVVEESEYSVCHVVGFAVDGGKDGPDTGSGHPAEGRRKGAILQPPDRLLQWHGRLHGTWPRS